MTNETSAGEIFLSSTLTTFQSQKKLAERAILQVTDEQLRTPVAEHTNSITIIMKHMAGNMLSRWTEFLTTDGEKPWRHRDNEFVDDITSREELMSLWERGWSCLLATLEALTVGDLMNTVTIRGEPHSVILAVHRQLDHYGYHVGQIVLIARMLAKEKWITLSVPPGGSEEYNRRVWKR